VAVRPFLLINNTERENIVARVQRALGGWQEEWFASASPPTVMVPDSAPEINAPGRIHKNYKVSERNGIAVSLPVDWETRANAWMTGSGAEAPANGEIAQLVIDQMTRALAAAILRPSGSAVERMAPMVDLGVLEPDGEALIGAVDVHCQIASTTDIWLRLWPGVVDEWLAALAVPSPQRVTLSPALEALTDRPVAIEAILGEAELTLDELYTLGVGDVIRLDRRLEDPLTLRLSDKAVCGGFLGTSGDRKAVQLTALDESLI
jgi:flagellar motor switch/type III secretory pathway protein FliN